MKRKFIVVFMALFLCMNASAQQTIRISGNVKFIDENFKMTLYRYIGRERDTLKVTNVDPVTKHYEMDVAIDKPGMATLDCGKWQDVNIWLEDEDLSIDFRGVDTAKVKIKNPPYVHIRGGRNNDLMNLVNWQDYCSYQLLIALANKSYTVKLADESKKQEFSMSLYDVNADNDEMWTRYFVTHFSDRNSVFVPLKRLSLRRDRELIVNTLNKLGSQSDQWREIADQYLADKEAALRKDESVKEGAVAPDFESFTEKGKKVKLSDFKGKVLVVDFWASWCGPCRQEIPNMKKFYADYDKKEIEFLSVSIDANRNNWLKAMKEENMPWQLTWVKDSGKLVIDLYQFSGIPYILVIDKEGKIFKKHLRGNAVRDAINEALNK